jgi:hypothetical protein
MITKTLNRKNISYSKASLLLSGILAEALGSCIKQRVEMMDKMSADKDRDIEDIVEFGSKIKDLEVLKECLDKHALSLLAQAAAEDEIPYAEFDKYMSK